MEFLDYQILINSILQLLCNPELSLLKSNDIVTFTLGNGKANELQKFYQKECFSTFDTGGPLIAGTSLGF